MDINRYYDYSDYDREGERYYSENYINRVNRRDINSSNSSSGYNCSKKYYDNLLKEQEEITCKIKIMENRYWLSYEEEKELDALKYRHEKIEKILPTLTPTEIKVSKNRNVEVGKKVELYNIANGKTFEYEIVMPAEADLLHNKLSSASPIAQAILGKTYGDVVDIQVPRGIISFEIMSIY